MTITSTQHYATIAAMLIPLVAAISIGLAISKAPWFSWKNNALSDLGIDSQAAIFFNGGMVLCGVLGLFFISQWHSIFYTSLFNKLALISLFCIALGIIGVGLITEDYGKIHFWVAVFFFVTLILFTLFSSLGQIQTETSKKIGYLGIILVCIAIFQWKPPWPKGIAIPEAISSTAGVVWIFIIAYKVYKYGSLS